VHIRSKNHGYAYVLSTCKRLISPLLYNKFEFDLTVGVPPPLLKFFMTRGHSKIDTDFSHKPCSSSPPLIFTGSKSAKFGVLVFNTTGNHSTLSRRRLKKHLY